MKTTDSAQQRRCGRNDLRHRFRSTAGATLTITALFISCSGASLCSAESQSDGAALYRKHCSTCHPQALKTRSTEDLFGMVRTPPPGMPAYGEDKLSDPDVQAIGEHLFSAAPGEPPAAALVPRLIAQEPVRASSGRERTPKAGKSAREKRAWISSFGTPED